MVIHRVPCIAMQVLLVGGRPVPGGECQNVDTVIFSKDGQHYGAVCSTPQFTKALIVDGKRMREYVGILERPVHGGLDAPCTTSPTRSASS